MFVIRLCRRRKPLWDVRFAIWYQISETDMSEYFEFDETEHREDQGTVAWCKASQQSVFVPVLCDLNPSVSLLFSPSPLVSLAPTAIVSTIATLGNTLASGINTRIYRDNTTNRLFLPLLHICIHLNKHWYQIDIEKVQIKVPIWNLKAGITKIFGSGW